MQQLREIILQNKQQLITGAAGAIHRAYNAAFHRQTSGSKPHEPAFVASLICDGLPELHASWQPLLRGVTLEIAGVYCHQSPKVTWPGIHQCQKTKPSNSIELGDLLMCHFHTSVTGREWNCALLMQAKMVSKLPHKIQAQELTQLYLYEDYPRFTYTTPSTLQGQPRAIARRSGRPLRYLALDGVNTAVLTRPESTLINFKLFDLSLVHLLGHWAGRVFVRTNFPQNDDWSRVVMDLLIVVANRVFRLGDQGMIEKKRGIRLSKGTDLRHFDGVSCQIAADGSRSKDAGNLLKRVVSTKGPPSRDGLSDRAPANEEDAGTSVIIIHTSESEGYRRS